ncbi:hypothetical protein PSAC2689_120253 [Paraburkholderia sacchari]
MFVNKHVASFQTLTHSPNRLLKYLPAEAAFLRLRGSRCALYRIVQFQRGFHACSAV